jgi:hypothetical protein
MDCEINGRRSIYIDLERQIIHGDASYDKDGNLTSQFLTKIKVLRLLNDCVENREDIGGVIWDALILRFRDGDEYISDKQRGALRADYLSLLFGGEWAYADGDCDDDVHYQVVIMKEGHLVAGAGNRCVQCKSNIDNDAQYCEKCLSSFVKFCSCGARLVPGSNISAANLCRGKDRCSKCQRFHKGRNPGIVEPQIEAAIQIIGGEMTFLVTGIDLQEFTANCVVCDSTFERVEVLESKYEMICQGCIKGELVAQECRKCQSTDNVCILQVKQRAEFEEVLWCSSCANKRLTNLFSPRIMRIILDGRDISDIKICQCGRFKTVNVNCTPHQMKPSGLCMDCQFQGQICVKYSLRLIRCFRCDCKFDCRIGQNILSCPRCFSSSDIGVGGIFRLPMTIEPDLSLMDVDHNILMGDLTNYGDDFVDMRNPNCWDNNVNLRKAFHFLLKTCEINTSFYGEMLHDFIMRFRSSLKTLPHVFCKIVPWKSKGTRDYFGMVLNFLDLEGKGGHILDYVVGNDIMYKVHFHNFVLNVSKTSNIFPVDILGVEKSNLTTLFFGLYMSTDIDDYEKCLKSKFDELCVGGLSFFREFVLDGNFLVAALARYIEEDRQCFCYFRSLSAILFAITSVGYKILGVYRISDLTSEYLFIVTK